MSSNTRLLIKGHNAELKVFICQEVIPVSKCHMDNRRKVVEDLQLFSGDMKDRKEETPLLRLHTELHQRIFSQQC